MSETTGLPGSDARAGQPAFVAPPGKTFGYSSLGYEYLQFVIEKVTARSLEGLSGDQVFLPFGMVHTSFLARPRLAGRVLSTLEIGPPSGRDRDDVEASGADSLLTTAPDYARFLSRLAELPDLGPLRGELWRPHAFLTEGASGDGPGNLRGLSWCLGWGRYLSPHGEVRFQSGCPGGCASYAALYLEQRVGFVVLVAGAEPADVLRDAAAAFLGDDMTPVNVQVF